MLELQLEPSGGPLVVAIVAKLTARLPGWLPGLVRIGLGCFIQFVFWFNFLDFCLSLIF